MLKLNGSRSTACFALQTVGLQPHEIAAVMRATHRPNYVLQVRAVPCCAVLALCPLCCC